MVLGVVASDARSAAGRDGRAFRRIRDRPFARWRTMLVFTWEAAHHGVWSMKNRGTDLRLVTENRTAIDARWAMDGLSFYYLITDTNGLRSDS